MKTLHSYRKDNLSLSDALLACPKRPLVGYCLTPASFVFARWHGGAVETVQALAIGQVYEARFFDADGELRWLRDPEAGEAGTAVWISEQEAALSGWVSAKLDVEPVADARRMMTGTLAYPSPENSGWWEMNAPRHGKLEIPMSDGVPGRRPAYIVREYLGSAPGSAGKDGNLMVVEERIVGIALHEPNDKGGR